MQEDGCDKEANQSYLGTKKNAPVVPYSRFQPCQYFFRLCYRGEYLNWYLKLVAVRSFCPFTGISLLMPLVLFDISFVFSALISMPWAVDFSPDTFNDKVSCNLSGEPDFNL